MIVERSIEDNWLAVPPRRTMCETGPCQGCFHQVASVIQLMLAFFLAGSGLALNAQVKGEKTSLELGSVTVWLGMPRQEVVKRCASAGYSVTGPGDELEIRDSEKLTTDSHIFKVVFKNDRVTYASRNWYESNASLFDAVLGALEQLGDVRGGCSVAHHQDKTPDKAFERVDITCGFRRVRIVSGKFGNGESVASVYEQIDSREP